MNSTNNEDTKENLPSNSVTTNSDNNANLNLTIDESKGAIPKRKLIKICSKKTNNNIDEFYKDCKQNGCSASFSSRSSYLQNYIEPDKSKEMWTTKPEMNSSYLPLDPTEIESTEACTSSDPKNYKKDSSDSCSDENELLSVSDDGCIYTYKGDYLADLPSSFFNLEIAPIDNVEEHRREENQSPEMDFLEMDFDPGVSGDAEDTNSESSEAAENDQSLPLDTKEEEIKTMDENLPPLPINSIEIPEESITKNVKNDVITTPEIQPVKISRIEVKMPWSCPVSERTRAGKTLRTVKKHHSSKGDLNSPTDGASDITLLSPTNKMKNSGKIFESEMIWTQQEAHLNQVVQTAPSSCGAAAVINVLNALRLPIPTQEIVQESVNIKLRANSSPLTDYLLSRSKAGCNHRDIIKGLDKLSEKRVYSRFFAMYPERIVNLQTWLGFWIRNGAVPIATINLQKCEGTIPDSWHHQMIFGVDSKGIYLTNPLECVDPQQLWPQLSSESVLLIRREDVVARWNAQDMIKLMQIKDLQWRQMNVVGQVAKVVRESRRKARVDCVLTSHVKIPADYKAGVILVIDVNSPVCGLLRQSPELPLLKPDDVVASAF